jgi:hypothetical protein
VGGKRAVYEVVRTAPGALVVLERGGERELSRVTIQQVELRVRQTRGRQIASYAVLIGLVGAATGTIIGLADGDDPPSGWGGISFTAGDKAVMGGVGLGAGGAGLGALLGAVAPLGTRWKTVPLEGLALDVAPGPGGAALAITRRH